PERVRTPRSCLLRCGLLAEIAPVALDDGVKRRLALRSALLQNPAWILPRAFAGCRVDQLPLLAADTVARFPNNIPIVHASPLMIGAGLPGDNYILARAIGTCQGISGCLEVIPEAPGRARRAYAPRPRPGARN